MADKSDKKKSSHKPFGFLKLYFTIISIAGVVGTVVAFGVALSSWINRLIISDTEYVAGNHYFYEIQACEQGSKVPVDADEETPEKTDLEIQLCKQEVTQRLLDQRKYDTKTTVVGGIVWGVLFAILFVTHFPSMLKGRKDE